MIEYHLLRFVLGVGLLYLTNFQLLTPALYKYVVFMGAAQILPQFLDTPLWMQGVWLPLDVVQAVLGMFVCLGLFKLCTQSRTYWWERTSILTAAGCFGSASVLFLMALELKYENFGANSGLFQTFLLLRQYYRLCLLSCWFIVVYWFCIWKAVRNTHELRVIIVFWSIWLVCQFVMATTCEPCLLWKVVSWHGGRFWSRLVGDSMEAVQLLSLIWASLQLKRKEGLREEYS